MNHRLVHLARLLVAHAEPGMHLRIVREFRHDDPKVPDRLGEPPLVHPPRCPLVTQPRAEPLVLDLPPQRIDQPDLLLELRHTPGDLVRALPITEPGMALGE